MENSFLNIFLWWSKHSKKIELDIWTFWFEICFSNQFWTLGSGQIKIAPIGMIGVISVVPLPKVRNWFQKQISNQNVHIFILKKIFERFDYHKEIFKKGFSIIFPNSDLGGGGQILWQLFFFWKSQTSQNMAKF